MILGNKNHLDISSEDKKKYEINEDIIDSDENIPNFWMKALINSKFYLINDNDKKVLKYLKDVKLIFNPDKFDFSVEFIFDKNEYFEHDKLVKKFFYDKINFEPIKQTATEIQWSSKEKNPLIKIENKKVRSKYSYFKIIFFNF